MATVLERPTTLAKERLFFLIMAILIATTVFCGFGIDIVARHAWFTDFP